MKIFRVEHKNTKTGPWFHSFDDNTEFVEAWEAHHSLESHPSPPFDGIRNFVPIGLGSDKLGTKSFEDLQDWFGAGDIPDILHKTGFVFAIYEADAEFVKFGKTQVAFAPEFCKLVEIKSVMELKN